MMEGSAPTSFEFVRPFWLFGLLALPLLGWAFTRWRAASGWEDYIDAEKLRFLSVVTPAARSWMRPLLITALACALLALAGPSWRTIPLPVKQPRDALVIAFDLSPSMLATDLNPDRLTRARLKIIDLLRLRSEGETALIAYADDAYRVSPLTDDASTIEALVPSLHPDVMPAPGSQVEAAAAMARELIEGAGAEQGVLLVVTDGIDPSAIDDFETALGDSMRLCILSVGGVEGVPIPVRGGGFARDGSGRTILAGVDRDELRSLANRHGGCYSELRSDDADLDRILGRLGPQIGDELDPTEAIFDVRQDEGYWLVLLLLPIAALGFRKNVLWTSILFLPATLTVPGVGHAFGWEDLWLRADQQQVREIEQGIERYREGDYAGAAEDFAGDSRLQHYNRGNALALNGQLEEALESYDQALAEAPDDGAARHNREVVEQLLQAQQQQQGPQQGSQESSEQSEEGDQNEPNDGSEGDSEGSSSQQPQDSTDAEEAGDSSDSESDSESASQEHTEPSQDTQDDSTASPEASQADAAEEESSQAASDPGEESDAEEEENESAQSVAPEDQPLSDQSEQWLRNIPDDPGGLMRRKFEYQAEQRRQRGAGQRSTTRY